MDPSPWVVPVGTGVTADARVLVVPLLGIGNGTARLRVCVGRGTRAQWPASPSFAGWPGDSPLFFLPRLTYTPVPQMSVDLIVNTLAVARVGYVLDEAVLPLVASNVYSRSGELSLACELFQRGPVVLLQLRSAFRKNTIAAFCQRLRAWIDSVGTFAQGPEGRHALSVFSRVRAVVVLGSFDAAWLQQPNIEHGTIKFLSSHAPWDEVLRASRLQPLEWSLAVPPGTPSMREAVIGPRTYADCLLRALDGLAFAALLLFCSEGQNVVEAQILADCCGEFLHRTGVDALLRQGSGWLAPVSWAQLLGELDETTHRQLYE